MSTVKTCRECGIEKPIDAFHARRLDCKLCRNAKLKQYRKDNSVSIKDRNRELYLLNKKRGKIFKPRCIPATVTCHWCKVTFEYVRGPKQLAASKHHFCTRSCAASFKSTTHGKTNSIEFRMLSAAKQRARKKQLPFMLTLADIPQIPETCPVLGIPLKVPSLDRIVPSLGYVPGNVRVISCRANTLRNDATATELMLVAQDVAKLPT